MTSHSSLDKKAVTCNSLEKSRYSEILVEVNQLERYGFGCWLFNPGMTFNSPLKWWGDFGQRDFPHEGIDICIYSVGQHKPRRIDEKNRIPVLATSVGDIPLLIEDGITGFLVPPGNSKALEKRMIELIDDQSLVAAMSENAYKRVVEKFSADRMVKETERLYLSVLQDD